MTERTLLKDARVLRCSGDPTEVLVAGDVLIEDDRIAAVSAGPLDVGEGTARVIDLGGATVLPGLGDAHTHISWPLDFVFDHAAVAATPPARHALDVAGVTRTFLESGYTLIIGAGATQFDDDVLANEAIERGLVTGPRIIPGGAMIADPVGLGGDGQMMQVAPDAKAMREIVKRQCESGVRALKLFISGDGIVPEFPSEDVYMDDARLEAAVDEADRHGAFVTVHARGAESVTMAARTGVRIIHHACFLDDASISAIEARRDDLFVCPGLHYLYAMVNGHAEPWGMTPEKVESSGYREELRSQIEGLGKLRATGVRILAGGDFGHQWTHHGTYAAELQRYVELVDMTPIEALHTATRNMGPAAGLESGEIRVGALADLLVLDGDPTTDIGVLQDPDRRRFVVKGGAIAWVNPTVYP